MLEMSSGLAIAGADGPAVGIEPHSTVAHRDHWLNGDAHSCLEKHSVAALPIVGNGRIFVHLSSDAVSGDLANHAVAGLFAVFLNSSTYIADVISRNCLLDALVERLFRSLEQSLHFLCDLADANV